MSDKRVALDILTYLYRVYFGTTSEEIDFRVRYGSNGVVNKVIDYIEEKYLKEEIENE